MVASGIQQKQLQLSLPLLYKIKTNCIVKIGSFENIKFLIFLCLNNHYFKAFLISAIFGAIYTACYTYGLFHKLNSFYKHQNKIAINVSEHVALDFLKVSKFV